MKKREITLWIICILITSLSSFYLSFFKLVNHDIWFHLKIGELIYNNFTLNHQLFIPHEEIFSHTMKGKPWTAHEWLFGVLSYLIFSISGINGLILVKAVIIIITFLLLYWMIYIKTRVPALALLFTIIPLTLSRFRFYARPDSYSFLFVMITIYAIHNFERGKKLPLSILPVITLFWVNIHGAMGIICPGILFLFYISRFIERVVEEGGSPRNLKLLLKKDRLLAAVTILCVVSLFLNPSFSAVIVQGLKILLSHSIEDIVQVPEWTSPGREFSGFWIYLVLSSLILCATFRILNFYDLILFILFASGAISARRNIPFFVMVTAPIIANRVLYLLNKLLKPTRAGERRFSTISTLSSEILTIIILIATILNTPPHIAYGRGIKDNTVPENAVKFLKETGIKGKMYNTHWFGGYLTFILYPEYEIFIDGRNTIFAPIWKKFKNKPWQEVLDDYDVDLAVIDFKKDSQYKNFKNSPLWHLIYFDDLSAIFVKDGYKENSLKGLYYKYLSPETSQEDVLSLVRSNSFILDEAIRHSKQVPLSAKALILVGNIYLGMNNFVKAELYIEKALKVNPKSVDALIALGYIKACTTRVQESITLFEKALKIDPDVQGRIYASMADKYFKMGELEKGITLMLKALKEDPKNPLFHKNLGLFYEKSGNVQKAEYHYNLAKKYE